MKSYKEYINEISKESINESPYEYKDGKVMITRANFKKVPDAYKNAKKGKESMVVLNRKTGGTVLAPVQFLEEDSINEKSKLHPDLVAIDKEIDAFHERTKHHRYLPKKESLILDKLSKKRTKIWMDLGGDEYLRQMTD